VSFFVGICSILAFTELLFSSSINCCTVHQRVGGLQDISRLRILMVRILHLGR
jgi:hypothetical protein